MNISGFRRFLGYLGILPAPQVNTALTTAGAGTITAAALVGQILTRTGPVAAFTDTTVTAAALIAAMPVQPAFGTAWRFLYRNTSAFDATIAGGTGVTVSGNSVVPANSTAAFLVTYTAAGTFTMLGLAGSNSSGSLPAAKYSTAALQSASLTAASLTGANFVNYDNTGTTPGNLQVPSAAALLAAHPNAQVGQSYMLAIRNSAGGANTATIVTDAGATVTLTGTMTIAQNVTRYFVVTFNTATTATFQSMGVSAAGA